MSSVILPRRSPRSYNAKFLTAFQKYLACRIASDGMVKNYEAMIAEDDPEGIAMWYGDKTDRVIRKMLSYKTEVLALSKAKHGDDQQYMTFIHNLLELEPAEVPMALGAFMKYLMRE